MGYIKNLLYRHNLRNPASLSDKIDLIKELNPSPSIYSCRASISTVTINVVEAVKLLEYTLSIDYDIQYAVPRSIKLCPIPYNYVSLWYSVDGRLLADDVFYTWLALVKKVNKLYLSGLKADKNDKAYLNSIKLKGVMLEADIIVTELLRLN